MDKITTYEKEEIIKLISSLDVNEFNKYCHEDVNEDDLLNLLKQEIKTNDFKEMTVLGIDIYHYSEYKPLEQTLIPILFKLIYDKASELCCSSSSFLFQKYKNKEKFRKMFIDTGDGGFQIFDTPIQAIAFAVNFQMIVRYYNSYRYYPKLRKIVGPLSLRYAMTHDMVHKLDNNYFGPAIINNSRILNRDSLNRFLLDENTNNWLLYKINGIENLQNLSLTQLKDLRCFADYKKVDGKNKIYSDTEGFNFGGITGCDIQKIGDIVAKKTQLTIYNLHLQYSGLLGKDIYNTIVTLGNLNTSGIS